MADHMDVAGPSASSRRSFETKSIGEGFSFSLMRFPTAPTMCLHEPVVCGWKSSCGNRSIGGSLRQNTGMKLCRSSLTRCHVFNVKFVRYDRPSHWVAGVSVNLLFHLVSPVGAPFHRLAVPTVLATIRSDATRTRPGWAPFGRNISPLKISASRAASSEKLVFSTNQNGPSEI